MSQIIPSRYCLCCNNNSKNSVIYAQVFAAGSKIKIILIQLSLLDQMKSFCAQSIVISKMKSLLCMRTYFF